MKNGIINFLSERSKYWWTSLLVGILAIVMGVWCMATPIAALMTITYVFIFGFLFSGISDIIFALSNKSSYPGWGWTFTGGMIDVMFAIILLALPVTLIAQLMIYFMAFWIMFRSIWAMGAAFELHTAGVKGWGWLLTMSIMSLLFAIWCLFSPIVGGMTIVVIASIAFMWYGIFRIYYSFVLKKVNTKLKKIMQ